MTLACKHVDDVVIGAPYIITDDLIKSLNIKKVIKIVNTDEDKPKKKYENIDQFQVPREKGILTYVTITEDMYHITTEDIAQRVFENQPALQLKFKKKSEKERAYYENKKAVEEIMN